MMTNQFMKIPSITSLKKYAKTLAQNEKIPLSHALNKIANHYGFTHWPLLMKQFNAILLNRPNTIWHAFLPCQMMLLSACEGGGKLSMALNLATIALQEKTNVNYYSMYYERDIIIERFKKIAGEDFATTCLNGGRFNIIDTICDEKALMTSINRQGVFIIIDFIQALQSLQAQSTAYESLILKLKTIAHDNALRVLVLSQVQNQGGDALQKRITGGKPLARHFNHALHLEKLGVPHDKRALSLVKSTHLQHHEAMLNFSNKTFRFN
jgi:hypothetical protein